MNHTPGPWEYEPSTKTIRAKPSNYWLATLDSWDGAIKHQNNANARLIAAAPELLEACQYVIKRAKNVNGKLFPLLPILNAIRKAEGREP